MKIHHILERRDSAEPAGVDFEHEVQDANGEWHSVMIRVSGQMRVERDPYGTGDSPSQTTFIPTDAYVIDTGEPFDLKTLSPKELDWIYNNAE